MIGANERPSTQSPLQFARAPGKPESPQFRRLRHASIPPRFRSSRRQSRGQVFSRNGKLLRVVRCPAVVRKLFSQDCQTPARKRRSWLLNFPPRALPPGCGRKRQRQSLPVRFRRGANEPLRARATELASQMHSCCACGQCHVEPVVYKNARWRQRRKWLGLSLRFCARLFGCDIRSRRASIRVVPAVTNPFRESAPSQRRQRWPREFSQVKWATAPEESSDFRSVT